MKAIDTKSINCFLLQLICKHLYKHLEILKFNIKEDASYFREYKNFAIQNLFCHIY